MDHAFSNRTRRHELLLETLERIWPNLNLKSTPLQISHYQELREMVARVLLASNTL